MRYNAYQFDSGLRTKREARCGLNPEELPKKARRGENFWDQPSRRLYSAQEKHQHWTYFANAQNLRKLSQRSKDALMMFYWEGRPAAEIAEILKVKVDYHLWVILHRARKELIKVSQA